MRVTLQDTALRAEGLWFAYRETEWVLKDVSFSAPRGQVTVIMGPSGTGKTTLLKILAGILIPNRGAVEVFNHPVTGKTPRALSPFIGYIPQQLGLVRNLTAIENVLMGSLGRSSSASALLGLFPSREKEMAQAALDLMGIGHKSSEQVFRLSGGERQRVAIARTLLQHPKVVVADEFVSDLDTALASEILARIRQAAEQEQITFVMSMHRQGLVRDFAENIVTLREGRLGPGLLPVARSGKPITGELSYEV
jgi:phosphonate transport system ATP-binding protein